MHHSPQSTHIEKQAIHSNETLQVVFLCPSYLPLVCPQALPMISLPTLRNIPIELSKETFEPKRGSISRADGLHVFHHLVPAQSAVESYSASVLICLFLFRPYLYPLLFSLRYFDGRRLARNLLQ